MTELIFFHHAQGLTDGVHSFADDLRAEFVYPGDRHLFTDRTLPAYDEDAAALVKERVLAFL